MTSEGKEKKRKEKKQEGGRDKERERESWQLARHGRSSRQGVACLGAIRSFLVWWTLIFARFLSRYAAITYPPYFLSFCERNGEEARPLLLPRLGSIHHHAGTEKRSCLFQVRGRYLLRQLQRPSTSVWGFTWRAPLCVDLFIKNVREDGVRREKRRGGEEERKKNMGALTVTRETFLIVVVAFQRTRYYTSRVSFSLIHVEGKPRKRESCSPRSITNRRNKASDF